MAPVIVLGALNFDVCGTPAATLCLHDSNPGSVSFGAGGVGHNIAHHLAACDIPVELVTLLGDDYTADFLSRHCADASIGLRHAIRRPQPSPTYLCVHDERGDLAVAINDMSLMDHFTPDILEALLPVIHRAPLAVVDANLPADTLALLATEARVPLLLDPVSCFKAGRASGVIGRFTAIKPNRREAAYLSGEEEPARAADWFLRQGTRHVFISLGSEGIYYAGEDGRGALPAPAMRARSTNGAGDATVAGIALGLLHGYDTRACAQLGLSTVTQHLLKQGGVLL